MSTTIIIVATVTALVVIAAILSPLLKPLLTPGVPESDSLPYQTRPLLTAAEKDFFLTLQAALSTDAILAPQVPIAQIVKVVPNTQDRQAWHNKIDRKTIDFVALDPETLDPIAAIELDDKSHNQPRRAERDEFVNTLFKTVGLPLHRVPARRAHAPAQLRALILSR